VLKQGKGTGMDQFWVEKRVRAGNAALPQLDMGEEEKKGRKLEKNGGSKWEGLPKFGMPNAGRGKAHGDSRFLKKEKNLDSSLITSKDIIWTSVGGGGGG